MISKLYLDVYLSFSHYILVIHIQVKTNVDWNSTLSVLCHFLLSREIYEIHMDNTSS